METAWHKAVQHSSLRRIALCVDDYGLNDGINRAVLDLAALGRVQATSVMVGGPAWAQGVGALRALDATQVEVGLHLDLTECALHPALRYRLGTLLARAYLRQLPVALLRTEISAQLDTFTQALGRAPAYIDGHQHVHQLPVVRTLLLEEIARRYPAATLWLRSTQSPPPAAHADTRTAFKSTVIAALGQRALLRQARRQGLRHNARLLGVYDFTGGRDAYRARLQRWLAAARDGDLLMCHVGHASAQADVLAGARQDEMAVLAGPQFPQWLADAGVQLRPIGHLCGLAKP